MSENSGKLMTRVRRTLGDLSTATLDEPYAYSSLALCVIDAVFSLGVRYESTWRTVCEWCARYGWERDRAQAKEERTTSDFLCVLAPYENCWEDMAAEVFRNRQRTSPTSGILKAEAVYRFARTLQRFGVETFADAMARGLNPQLKRDVERIPGQSSGLSFNYFLILAGHEDAVKADRMVRRFVAEALGRKDISPDLAEQLVRDAAAVMRTDFPLLTPRLLDNAIWKYQRRTGGEDWTRASGTMICTRSS